MKTLVVYYSRTGNTQKIAKKIASEIGCDIEEIEDTQNRSGIIGFLRSAYQAIRGKDTKLKPYNKNPQDYDLVIIGTPIWGGRPSVPISTYLKENKGKFKHVAFFCTYGGTGFENTIETMKKITDKEPTATLDIRESEIKNEAYDHKIESFIENIKKED
ncbi:flavodoxin [Methanothermobacter tenebrarum]|uniref:Flavodoxin n=1 Tax=Methanothermobacter tenebrarum TaxID=680118 RepID=A0A328PBM1_9EURY|nr:flavodoxin [Methanothermobacter tenebrarum]MBC7100555.1 flavodoxin [Methanobacteriales archaeon]MBC7118369.1 flavodoxin [Methanobacteriaceae archaeon]NPV64192.1 flavodoxin [Methanobacteriaceae archaeon]RAO79809.1 flavodoxin [Methanothermobacter tenebrarum]